MRFSALASALLATSSAVLAAPATEQQNQCCCCDIMLQQVVCVSQAKPDECICAEVMCPSKAPTVFATGAPVATTMVPASLTSENPTPTNNKAKRQVDIDTEVHPQCCCCNAKLGSIVCTNTLDADTCKCGDDQCPNGAPTIHAAPGASATPTPPPRAHPLVGPIVIRDEMGMAEHQERDEDEEYIDYFGANENHEHHERDEEYIDYFGANENHEHHERGEYIDYFGANEAQKRHEPTHEWCCHCDFVNSVNKCTQSEQCGWPKIDNCVFETVYE